MGGGRGMFFSVNLNVRKHGEPWFSGTLVIGNPQENGEKPKDIFDCSSVFFGFSG